MSTAADRKAELEMKKERLRFLREEKFKREELRRQGLSGMNSMPSSSSDLRGEADALLKDLGIGSLNDQTTFEAGQISSDTTEEASRYYIYF